MCVLIKSENAFLVAQKIGKTPELCQADSTFLKYYNTCNTCVDTNAANSTDSITYLDTQFVGYLNYCNVEPAYTTVIISTVSSVSGQGVTKTVTATMYMADPSATTVSASYLSIYTTAETAVIGQTLSNGKLTTSTVVTSYQVTSTLPGYYVHLSIGSLISNYLPPGLLSEIAGSVSSAAALVSITGNPTSLVYSALEESSRPAWFTSAVPTTYTAQMNTLEAEIDSLKAEATGTIPSTPKQASSSRAWIAGAVAGPVAAVIVLLLGLFLIRRRRRRQRPAQAGSVVPEVKFEKAQLHGDSLPVRNPVFELDAARESHPQELPAIDSAKELHSGHHRPSSEGGTRDHPSGSLHSNVET